MQLLLQVKRKMKIMKLKSFWSKMNHQYNANIKLKHEANLILVKDNKISNKENCTFLET